jgi:general nucleoside transport system permease protein
MNELLRATFVVGLFSGMIRIATPILLAAMGELVAESAGVLNLSIEGTMLMGAFTGFLVAHLSGSLWLGVLAAIASGALMGLLMAFLASTLRADQTVSGLALNIVASGLAFYLFRLAFKNAGSQNLPSVGAFSTVQIPLLSRIPFVGEVLFTQHALTYLAFLMVPLISLFLYRTRPGLELRSIGENPRAVDMRGLDVVRRQYLAVIFGAMLAGLAGSFLTLASAGLFVPDISGGRGWIALAIVIFGNWLPSRILLGALFFGLIDASQLGLQAVGVHLPYQLLLALPYLLTIVALVLNRSRSRSPIALGRPYNRAERGA